MGRAAAFSTSAFGADPSRMNDSGKQLLSQPHACFFVFVSVFVCLCVSAFLC